MGAVMAPPGCALVAGEALPAGHRDDVRRSRRSPAVPPRQATGRAPARSARAQRDQLRSPRRSGERSASCPSGASFDTLHEWRIFAPQNCSFNQIPSQRILETVMTTALQDIPRYKTAIGRSTLSRPVKLALADGLIDSETSLFDYGCG